MLNNRFVLSHPLKFIDGLSCYYPVPEHLLARYEHLWDWDLLSRNTAIQWNAGLLERFKHKWNWEYRGLSNNKAMPWSLELLELFRDKWSWYHLGWEEKVINSKDLLPVCISHWDDWKQNHLFTSGYMPAMEENIHAWVKDFLGTCPNLNWKYLSAYDGFSWTADFIEKHADKLDWNKLSGNTAVVWTRELIDKYIDKCDWFELSYYGTLSWDLDMLRTYHDHINWYAFSVNTERNWTPGLLIDLRDKLHWVNLVIIEGGYIGWAETLCNNPSIQWTPELYAECDQAITGFFSHLTNEKKDLLEDSNFILLREHEHWTVHLNASNWTESFMTMLIQLEEDCPEKRFINWNTFAANFNKWDEWSRQTVDDCLLQTDLLHLAENTHFPWNSFPEQLQKLNSMDKEWRGWNVIGANPGLRLTEDIIEQFKDKWDWSALSANPTLTLSMIPAYEEQWDWYKIFENNKFSNDIIKAYPDKWKFWWHENRNPPFGTLQNFASLLDIPEHSQVSELIRPDELEEFLLFLNNRSEAEYRENFEKALDKEDFKILVPSIMDERYNALLIEYADKILSAEWPASFAITLGTKALTALTNEKFTEAIELFKLSLRLQTDNSERDLTIYCNALYALQNDNTGLPIDKTLNEEFLEKCLAFAPQNPAIYFNAACLYVEMNDLDNAFTCIRLAKEHQFEDYVWMIGEIKKERIFAEFVKDERFKSLT